MLTEIIRVVAGALKESGATEVYSAFDAYPTERKGAGYFTLVSTGGLECTAPVYSTTTVYLPYKAKAEIMVTAPESENMAKLYSYYDSKVAPAIDKLTDLNGRLTKLSIKQDSNIGRLVLTAEVTVSGIRRIERSTE